LADVAQAFNSRDDSQLRAFSHKVSGIFTNMSAYFSGPDFQETINEQVIRAPQVCLQRLPPLPWASSNITSSTLTTTIVHEQNSLLNFTIPASVGQSPYLPPVSTSSLNAILNTAVISGSKLISIRQGALDLDIHHLECKRLGIGALGVSSNRLSPRLVQVRLSLMSIKASCVARWAYKLLGGVIQGVGAFSLELSKENSVNTTLIFSSLVDNGPPVGASMLQCAGRLPLDISLSGGVEASFLDMFSPLIESVLGATMNDLLCKLIGDIGPALITEQLISLSGHLGAYVPCSPGQIDELVICGVFYTQCSQQQTLPPHPLAAERALEPKVVGRQLLNMSSPMISSISSSLQANLGGKIDQKNSDLGINEALGKFLGNEGRVSMDLGVRVLESSGIFVAIKNVSVSGLDTFTELNMPKPISKWTIAYGFNLSMLRTSIGIQLAMHTGRSPAVRRLLETMQVPRPVCKEPSSGKILPAPNLTVENVSVNTTFRLSLGFDGLSLDAANLVAWDIGNFRQLQVGQIFAKPLSCVMKSLAAMSFSELFLAVADVHPPEVDGLIGEGVDAFVNGIVEAAFDMYKAPVLKALPRLSTEVMEIINNFTRSQHHRLYNSCPPPAPLSGIPRYFNFASSSIFSKIAGLLNNFLDPDSEGAHARAARLNTLVGDFTGGMNTDGVPGVVEMAHLFSVDQALGDFGRIMLSLSNLKVTGLSSFSELTLLEATSKHSLMFVVEMGPGTLPTSAPQGVHAQVDVKLNLEGGIFGNSLNEFELSFGFSSFRIAVDMLAMVDLARINDLRMEQLLVPECLLATFRPGGLGIRNATVDMQGLSLGFTCKACSLTDLQRLDGQNGTTMRELSTLLQELFGNASSYLTGSLFQAAIDESILRAPAACAQKLPPLAWAPVKTEGASTSAAVTMTSTTWAQTTPQPPLMFVSMPPVNEQNSMLSAPVEASGFNKVLSSIVLSVPELI
jgi:hypothetical protein